jgi:hypothetical protein
MTRYLDLNRFSNIHNPIKSHSYHKQNIIYQYSGPIYDCQILDEIIVYNINSSKKYYNWESVNLFFSKYNLYFKDIHIVKYNINNTFKYHFVITFNNDRYVWERNFNKSIKGGINVLYMYCGDANANDANANDNDHYNEYIFKNMYTLLKNHNDNINPDNKELYELFL